jgi:hypothetical protein
MNLKLSTVAILVSMLFSSMNVMAAGPLQNLSNASKHSAQAVGQTSIAGVKIVSGIVAVPLMAVGEIGGASGQAGHALWDNASKSIGEPLEITDELITTTVSPDQAMAE